MMKNWFKEYWKKAGNRQGVDLNLNPKNQEEQYYRAESHVSPYTTTYRPFIVAAHGSYKGVGEYPYAKPNGKTPFDRGKISYILPEDLAKRIKDSPGWKKSDQTTVILYSCEVGLGDYAQKLADALGEGVIVYAPNGSITVGWVDKENEIETKSGEKGKMLKFVGRKVKDNEN